jgi:hypothetical protein
LNLKVDKVAAKDYQQKIIRPEKTKLAGFFGINTGDQDLSTYATNANLALAK